MSMDNNNSAIIIGAIIFIVILAILLIAFILMRKSGGNKAKKKTVKKRVRIKHVKSKPAVNTVGKQGVGTVRTPANKNALDTGAVRAPANKNASGAVAAKVPGTKSTAQRPAGQPLPTLKAGNDGIEKYARMTEGYLKTKHGVEVERIGLKKYYSERHGFDCVDFTYRPASGVLPAGFKTHLNDLDTALTNMLGVDTITFYIGDAARNIYKTTFYLQGETK